MPVSRISTLMPGYFQGALSTYPEAQDTPDTLYIVTNNATTTLAMTLPYTADYLIVQDTSSFPVSGLLKVGDEIIYYSTKTSNVFSNLDRGFAGSMRSMWATGTVVNGAVMAETHNALKDAAINMETYVGTQNNPSTTSLNGVLQQLEARYLAPKPIFRAAPTSGPAPLSVSFQNFSPASYSYLWNFGDGSTSIEFAPIHVYTTEGTYDVVLNVTTGLGAQGSTTKTAYVTVNSNNNPAYFYVTPLAGTTSTVFSFVDQSNLQIAQRYWMFGDGITQTELDPEIHYTTHTYATAGSYSPILILGLQDGTNNTVNLGDTIIVMP